MSCATVQEDATIEIRAKLRDKCTKRAADLTSVASVQIRLKPPTGATVVDTASVLGDPLGGIVRFLAASTVLSTKGSWAVQFVVTYNDASIARSSVGKITVLENI